MARLIFHRKFGYAGMTQDVVIRIDGELRLKLGVGDRAATSLAAGAHLIEATIGKGASCCVDLVTGSREEIYFLCRVEHFFKPAPVLELMEKSQLRDRFELDRKHKPERAGDRKAIEKWASVLNVRPDATLEEIHRAYIEQMRIYHPDLYVNRSEGFRQTAALRAREVNMAYALAQKHFRGSTSETTTKG